MKRNLCKKLFTGALIAGALLVSQTAQAQLDEIQKFLESGADNATALTQAYLKPLPTGLATTLNSGWNTKAAATKTLGFSIQVRAAVAQVPTGFQTFDASTLNLQNVNVSGTSSNTISGAKGSGQTISDTGNNFSFQLPGGSGFEYVPTAMIQANVGLIKGTDVTVRYIPETDLGSYGNLSLIGAGLKHNLNQWIPGGKLLPVDLSVMAAFSTIDLNADLNFNGGTDQVVETSTNTFVVNALVGKALPFVSAYAGVGYQTGSFELNMLGNYDIGGGQTLTDPVSYSDDSQAGVHALAGIQLKIAILRIYAEVTAAEFMTANAGIGIGFRK